MNNKSNQVLPTEYQECVTLATWLEINGYIFSHIPQETFTRFIGTKMKNKWMGVKAGVPDYLIIIPKKGLLFIEMKRQKGGRVSDEQKIWIDALNKLEGIKAKVCKGVDEAIQCILNF